MNKLSLIFTALLFISSSCAPQPISTSHPVTETPLPIPTLTAIPLPDISPIAWASNENGVVIPQKMYPLVGAIDKKHRRTIDLEYAGLRVAVVLGEGVDLQGPENIANHKGIRSFFAQEINKQMDLKQQLEQMRTLLYERGTAENSVVIIEGQNWPNNLLVFPPDGYISQVVEFGKIENVEIRARYVLENDTLRQLSKEEEPNLLPQLYTDEAYIRRVDTGDIVELNGFNVATFAIPGDHTFVDLLGWGLKQMVEADNWNINLLRVSLDSLKVPSQKLQLDQLVDYAEKHGIYILFNPHQIGDEERNDILPDQTIAQMMGELASRYRGKSNVLYGVWNEPQPDNYLGYDSYDDEWKLWLERATPVAEAIRSKNEESLIVVAGGRFWARDLSYYLSHPFEVSGNRQNIIYDIHDYDDLTNPETMPLYPKDLPDRPEEVCQELYKISGPVCLAGSFPKTIALSRAYAKKLMDDGIAPVLFGEYGSVGSAEENTIKGLQYMIDMFNLINSTEGKSNTAHWAVESIFADVYGQNFQLNPRGLLLYYIFNGSYYPGTNDELKKLFSNITRTKFPTNFKD